MFGFNWITNAIKRAAPTPEKTAGAQLQEARMKLFAAEQGVQDALTQADYWRRRVGFLEAIATQGVETWSDQRVANGVDDRAIARSTTSPAQQDQVPAGDQGQLTAEQAIHRTTQRLGLDKTRTYGESVTA